MLGCHRDCLIENSVAALLAPRKRFTAGGGSLLSHKTPKLLALGMIARTFVFQKPQFVKCNYCVGLFGHWPPRAGPLYPQLHSIYGSRQSTWCGSTLCLWAAQMSRERRALTAPSAPSESLRKPMRAVRVLGNFFSVRIWRIKGARCGTNMRR